MQSYIWLFKSVNSQHNDNSLYNAQHAKASPHENQSLQLE